MDLFINIEFLIYLYKKRKKMKKLFEIDENEKRRILEMHENATKRNYLMEQPVTPPPAQPENTTGAEVYGTQTIDKVKDAESLNKFYDWGGVGINGKTPNMAYRVGFTNIKTAEELQANSDARAAIEKVYQNLKMVVQKYTLSELCGNPTAKEGIDRQSLAIATNRAKDLGWCGTKTSSKPSKSEIRQKVDDPAKFQADRSKA